MTTTTRSTAAAPPAAAESWELLLARAFDAPRELVYRVWTRPEHLARWWGPRDFTTPSIQADLRPGGAYRICIRSPEGADHWMRGVYREVVEGERLVFTFAWEEEGGSGRPGPESLVTVTFAETGGGGTEVTFHQAPFPSAESRDSHAGGWSECLDRLEAYLAQA